MKNRTYKFRAFKRGKARIVLATGTVVYTYRRSNKMTWQTVASIAVCGLFVYGMYKFLKSKEVLAQSAAL